MEITNEIKFKVALQYYGQPFLVCYNIENNPVIEKFSGKNIEDGMYEPDIVNKRELLILKPISEINDEDAIEVAVLSGMTRPMNRFQFVISRHTNYAKRILSNYFEGYTPTEEEITGNVWLLIFQHLQSKGYDISHYLLGGKTLKEAGMAIYENEMD